MFHHDHMCIATVPPQYPVASASGWSALPGPGIFGSWKPRGVPIECLKASGSESQRYTNHLFLFLDPGRPILGFSFGWQRPFPQPSPQPRLFAKDSLGIPVPHEGQPVPLDPNPLNQGSRLSASSRLAIVRKPHGSCGRVPSLDQARREWQFSVGNSRIRCRKARPLNGRRSTRSRLGLGNPDSMDCPRIRFQ